MTLLTNQDVVISQFLYYGRTISILTGWLFDGIKFPNYAYTFIRLLHYT